MMLPTNPILRPPAPVTAPMKPVKFLDGNSLRQEGILQEINRQLLHPLGLAAVLDHINDNRIRIADHRDTEAGLHFKDTLDLRPKAEAVAKLLESRKDARHNKLGFVVQPTVEPKPNPEAVPDGNATKK